MSDTKAQQKMRELLESDVARIGLLKAFEEALDEAVLNERKACAEECKKERVLAVRRQNSPGFQTDSGSQVARWCEKHILERSKK